MHATFDRRFSGKGRARETMSNGERKRRLTKYIKSRVSIESRKECAVLVEITMIHTVHKNLKYFSPLFIDPRVCLSIQGNLTQDSGSTVCKHKHVVFQSNMGN